MNPKHLTITTEGDMGDIGFLVSMDIISQGNLSLTNNGKTVMSFMTPAL